MASTADPAPAPARSPLEAVLGVFADVRAGEGLAAVLLTINVFLLLTCYYILKTVREPLVLLGGVAGLKGEELKTYATAGQALLLLGLVPAYGHLASRVSRIKLINTTTIIFAGCLVAFWALARLHAPLGLAFFLWLGIFNMMVVAQFWSFANDLYTVEQGKRLFAIIAVGGSAGSILGAQLAGSLIGILGPFELMLVAAGVLLLCLVLANLVQRIEGRRRPDDVNAEAPLHKDGGFTLVMRTRYLLLIALMLLIANLVNTGGEYMLSATARAHAEAAVTAANHPGLDAAALKAARGAVIGHFYGTFFFWVNVASLIVQAFLVSRVIKYLGIRVALLILPVVALGSYSFIAVVPMLAIVRVGKVAENSLDYSLQNTVRQTLFLPTSREAKYKAKAAIDTFFVRFGDATAAAVVYVGLHWLGFGIRGFATVNVVLVALWVTIALAIGRENRRLAKEP